MDNDLFFIPLIADALCQKDVPSALREAFRRIQQMGREPRWEAGYRQFLTFMASVRGSQSLLEAEDLDRAPVLELLVERAFRSRHGVPSCPRAAHPNLPVM